MAGHSAVWGSFYDAEARRWGFACCRGTVRGEACPLRAAEAVDHAEPEAEAEDGPENAVAVANRAEWNARRLLDRAPPLSLGTRDASACNEDYLKDFILYWFHAWTNAADGDGPDAKAVQQTREALTPLLQQLKQKAVPQDLLGRLASFAELATEREYSKANDVYVGITIGKALWHSHLDLGQQRAHWGGGSNLRTMQKQVIEKDNKNATLFDTDPAVQRYVHALKRLVTFMQRAQPSHDPSKLGHVPAPVPAASEFGLPVVGCVRDSDGRGRMPEFVDPDDPMPSRGLAFGTESGRAHPFHGIGSARGV